jgi:hypothetical protein
MEWAVGQNFNGLLSIQEVKDVLELIDHLRLQFEVDQINRSGLRTYLFGKIERLNTLDKFIDQINGHLFESISAALGETKDMGFILQGSKDDGIDFRIALGPYFQPERSKYMEAITDEKSFDSYNFIYDIDLSQLNFRAKGQTSKAWIKLLTPRMTDVEQKVQKHLEGVS